MIEPNIRLSYYKRLDIQKEMVLHSQGREVGVRFGDRFGTRPDVLVNENDIFEYAKQGATSFHASEERWKNPLRLKSEMNRQEQDDLRTGWDLVIDVDSQVWEFSKLITAYIIQSLKENGVVSISCKFSGNKGFHVGVPFEAFPELVGNKQSRLRFPEAVRTVAAFLVEEIDKNSRFTDFIVERGMLSLLESAGIKRSEILLSVCARCKEEVKEKKKSFEYLCRGCGKREVSEKDDLLGCSRCGKILDKMALEIGGCKKCGSKEVSKKLDIEKILSIDTILISSRHLYRMPYSLHEKSGLVSIPIDPNKVLEFKKESARPQTLLIQPFRFLDRSVSQKNNAALLFDRALSWEIRKKGSDGSGDSAPKNYAQNLPTEAIPFDLFPPCIKLILEGMGDGKKRAVFLLINFLKSVGYDYSMIEKMIEEWNKKNKEPLREGVWRGQLSYHKQQNKAALPPNCQNNAYMLSMGVCKPDPFCARIKNPAQYSKKKVFFIEMEAKKGKRVKKQDQVEKKEQTPKKE